MDKEKEAELRQQYGTIVIAKIGGREFAFKTPEETDYEAMQDGLIKAGADKIKVGPVLRQYCLSAVVHPGPDELAEAFTRQPATVSRIADALSDLAGAEVEIIVKKG